MSAILAQWFLRRRFLKIVPLKSYFKLDKKIFKWHHPIFAFSWLSPLWRGPGPSFEQTWSPSTQGWCVPSLVEFGPAVLEKKSKMWKVNGQTDRQTTDNRWSEKLTWAFKLRWAKNIITNREHLNVKCQSPIPLHLKNLESPSPKDDLCQIWLKLACSLLEIFKNF